MEEADLKFIKKTKFSMTLLCYFSHISQANEELVFNLSVKNLFATQIDFCVKFNVQKLAFSRGPAIIFGYCTNSPK
ncbi:hypothetical protein [Candidatus Lariskella endosymbiont of Hedychridium roseum]|uniref:hypothetical protein n=1 Tax=Candidatus Lariskella endosymbiont of Hedychridium roseum TaxID=3077949 RepID=UPI0030D06274